MGPLRRRRAGLPHHDLSGVRVCVCVHEQPWLCLSARFPLLPSDLRPLHVSLLVVGASCCRILTAAVRVVLMLYRSPFTTWPSPSRTPSARCRRSATRSRGRSTCATTPTRRASRSTATSCPPRPPRRRPLPPRVPLRTERAGHERPCTPTMLAPSSPRFCPPFFFCCPFLHCRLSDVCSKQFRMIDPVTESDSHAAIKDGGRAAEFRGFCRDDCSSGHTSLHPEVLQVDTANVYAI